VSAVQPWVVMPGHPSSAPAVVSVVDGSYVATVHGPVADRGLAVGRANLIAAAPELLAALQAVLAHFDVKSYDDAFSLAAKAIAKATGSAA